MMIVNFELTGVTAALMHFANIEGNDRLKAWRKDPRNKNQSVPGDDRTPPWTWMTYLYGDGTNVCCPSENLMACIRKAAAQVVLKGKTTFKTVSQNGMLVTEEFCPFFANGKKIRVADVEKFRDETFDVHVKEAAKLGIRLWSKYVVVNRGKTIRVRPRFDKWAVKGSLTVTAKELTKAALEEIFGIAGTVGLFDWRPGATTPGPFGQFEAKLVF